MSGAGVDGAREIGRKSSLLACQIPMQREQALGAMIFTRAAERFGEKLPLWRAFCILQDFCLSAENPELMMRIVLDAETWEAAELEIYHFAGYPDADSYWNSE